MEQVRGTSASQIFGHQHYIQRTENVKVQPEAKTAFRSIETSDYWEAAKAENHSCGPGMVEAVA